MASFDFITDGALRRSLESDLAELALCHAACAWKAVHVLAGSIIEATLIDYLVSCDLVDLTAANTKDLAHLIEICETHGVLSEKAIKLSTIVRSYRNLIHPGRVLRLSETVDQHGAMIAKSVIEIVVDEVSKKKKETYGYTAEQVVGKIQHDPSSTSIAEHLLRETKRPELSRLLLSILPSAYIASRHPDEDQSLCRRLEDLFRLGVKMAEPELLALVGAKFVTVLKEEPEVVVECYELGLFRGSDLAFIAQKDQPLVIAHFFGTMRRGITERVCESAQGIAPNLHGETLDDFIGILASSIVRDKPRDGGIHPATTLLYRESWQRDQRSDKLDNELLAAISAVKLEYAWNDQMLTALDTLKDMVEVPF